MIIRLRGDIDVEIRHDPYRALAAAIVWRALQDAFCGRRRTPYAGICWAQRSCDQCRARALEWLLSDAGLQMIEWVGLDGAAAAARLRQFRAQGLYMGTRRSRGAPIWVTRR